jgi:hypothetical protein
MVGSISEFLQFSDYLDRLICDQQPHVKKSEPKIDWVIFIVGRHMIQLARCNPHVVICDFADLSHIKRTVIRQIQVSFRPGTGLLIQG